MSVNLMDMIKGTVSKQVMGQLGGLLGGADEKKTSAVFDNVAGSILGGMMKKAQTDDGARDVFDIVNKQDDSILDKVGDLMGGGGAQDQVMKQGGGILEGIMGGSSQQNSVFAMIAKALGLDEGMVGKIMMMAAPMIIGVIGKHLKSTAMDAAGLKGLLGEQGQHIAGSMAPGLVDQLGMGSLLSNVTAAPSAPAKPSMPEAGGGDMLKFVIPLLLLVGLIIAGIFVVPRLMGGGGETTVINSANVDEMEKDVRKRLEDLCKEVEGIKSSDDAETVKGSIDEFKKYVGGLKFQGVTAEQMQGVKGQLDMRLMKVALEEHAYKTDGVKDVLDTSVKALSSAIMDVQNMEK